MGTTRQARGACYQAIQVRIPSELAERLRTTAEARVVGQALLVTKAIEHYLNQLPPLPAEGGA